MADNRKETTAFIYAFSMPEGPTKIGRSISVLRRKKEIEKDRNCSVVIVGEWPMGHSRAEAAERYIHWLIRDKHIANEWFDIKKDEALSVITKALTDPWDARYIVPSICLIEKMMKRGEYIPTKFPRGNHEIYCRPLV